MNIKRIGLHLRKKLWKVKGVNFSYNSFIYEGNEIHNPKNFNLGENAIIYKNCSLLIGKTGSLKIGNDSHIAPYGYLLIDKNDLIIGNKVAIGPFCSFFCHSNQIEGASNDFISNYTDAPITLGNNVFIGAHCVILAGTVIKDNVVIAANSVVSGIIESNSLYGGSPAIKIKNL